ncbi:hypothetical protein LQ953_13380 [Sphingomonas sp. IC-56]|nr:hypothetical protein [Sphingomonas sp. IC-56]MCD2325010.1 hypothetical protein [Sphingomonas sp. IC-56]
MRRYEGGAGIAEASIDAMVDALVEAGVVFIASGHHSAGGGAGVRLAD